MKTLKQVLFKGTDKENDPSPFIIAEMSGNHGASLEKALKIIDIASETGVDAIKLQTFTPDSMTLNIDKDDFKVMNKKSLWYGRKLYDLFEEAQTKYEWHEAIFKRAKEKNILCFSTPFDEEAFATTIEKARYFSFDKEQISKETQKQFAIEKIIKEYEKLFI